MRRFARKLADFAVEWRGTICVLHVIGDVDASNSCGLEAAIEGAARSHRGQILVSFAHCTFADSSCSSVLTRQFELLRTRLLIVAPLGSRLRRVLDVASLTGTLPVYKWPTPSAPSNRARSSRIARLVTTPETPQLNA